MEMINFNDVKIVTDKDVPEKQEELDMGYRYSMKIRYCDGSFERYKGRKVYKVLIRDDAFGRVVFKLECSLGKLIERLPEFYKEYKIFGIRIYNETDVVLPDIKSKKRIIKL